MKAKPLSFVCLLPTLVFLPSCDNEVIPDHVSPTAVTYGDFTINYYQERQGYIVEDYLGKEESILVPDEAEFGGKKAPIVGIGPYAFCDRKGIKTITVGENVASIGEKAFFRSSVEKLFVTHYLLDFTADAFINSRVTFSVHDGQKYLPSTTNPYCVAFDGKEGAIITLHEQCEATANLAFDKSHRVNLPAGIRAIGSTPNNTGGCYFIPDEITEITLDYLGDRALVASTSLKEITLTEHVPLIGSYAFDECKNLTKVNLPQTITSIGEWAFHGCVSLTSLPIPESVKSIGHHAFYECLELAEVNLPSAITEIGESTFLNCSSLSSIQLPASLKTIGDEAFRGCHLPTIAFPATLESIGDECFADTRLTEINIPAKLTIIGERAFSNIPSLASITVEEGNPSFDSRDNCNALILTRSNRLMLGCKNTVVPPSVTGFESYAFEGCVDLKEFAFPKGTTTDWVPNNFFFNCSSLTSIVIPSPMNSVGNGAFENCKSLTSVTLPSSMKYLGNYTFRGCSSLKSIFLPRSVCVMGSECFANCTSLTSLSFGGTTKEWTAFAKTSYKWHQNSPLKVVKCSNGNVSVS